MSPANTIALIGAQLVLIALPAITLAWILRRAGLPGGRTAAAILAGLLVSLLAGPSVLAKVRPEIHNRIVLGGQIEHEQLVEAAARHRAHFAVLRETGASPQALEEAAARNADELAIFRGSRTSARAVHNIRLDWLSIVSAWLFLLLAAPTMVPSTRTARRRTMSGLTAHRALGLRLGLIAALGAFAVPFAVGVFMQFPVSQAAALGVVFAVGGLSAATTGLVFAAGGVALLATLGALVPVAVSPQLITLGGVLFGALVLATTQPMRLLRRWRTQCFRAATATALPAAIALSLVSTDYYHTAQHTGFWVVLVLAAVWSSDGRWFASAIAARITCPKGTSERDNPWLFASRMLDAGVGSAQIIAAIALTGAGVLPGYVLPAAVAGAAVIELTRGARAWMTSLIELQHHLEDEAADRSDR